MQRLEGKVAVVTGAASGIGRGIAGAFAAEGMRLVIADIDGARLQAEAERLRSAGGEVEAVVTDVSELADVRRLADVALGRFGNVNVVCNNAGTIRPGRTWELPLEDWERVLRVNLLGVLYGVHTFVPLILGSGEDGHVVNVGSMASVVPVPGIGPYNVAKHGVLALTEVLDAELRAAGAPVGVSLVMPGRVRARLGRPPEAPDDDTPAAPDAGLMEPEEVGRQVVGAMRSETLFVFTHPERVPEVRARFARITGP